MAYDNRGDWLLSRLQAALEAGSLFTVVDTLVAGKAPAQLPAVYVELINERLQHTLEGTAEVAEGESLFYLVAYYSAATNDGSSPALAAARNATVHKLEKLLAAIDPADNPEGNVDSDFRHSMRSLQLSTVTGQPDDKGRFGVLVAEVVVTWLRQKA